MKRVKGKKSLLKKRKGGASERAKAIVGASRRLAPTIPTAPTVTEIGQAPATTCLRLPGLPAGQEGTTSPMPWESITTVVEDELKPRGLESPQAEDTAPSPQPPDPSFEEVTASGRTLQLLAFLLGDEEYGVDILMVKEIIRLTEITPVPRASSYIQGIISLRGTVLPIFDLRQLLSMPDFKPDKKSRILVVSLAAGLIGIIVDAVTEVVELKEAELEPPPTVMGSVEADHIKGMGRYKRRLIILLDLEKVYLSRHSQVKSVQGQDTSV